MSRSKNEDTEIEMPSPGSSMFKLIQHLLRELFVAERRRLDKNVGDLIRRNNEIRQVQAAGFLYYGDYYTATGFQNMSAGGKITLNDSLNDDMEWHLKDAKTIAEDERLIGQTVFKLTDPCESLQEMRDSLPECLSSMIPALANITRQNEVGWSIRQDTRASRQFEKTLPKIEMYSAARLLY